MILSKRYTFETRPFQANEQSDTYAENSVKSTRKSKRISKGSPKMQTHLVAPRTDVFYKHFLAWPIGIPTVTTDRALTSK